MSSTSDLDLSKCFDFGYVSKNQVNLGMLCQALVEAVEEPNSKGNGWLMAHFEEDTISANEVLLYCAALLASHWQFDSNLLIALRKAAVGDSKVVLNEKFLRSILLATRQSEQNQTINEVAFDYLVAALDNPKVNLAKINERNETQDKGWIRSEWFSGSSRKTRFTTLEDRVFRFQVFLTIGTVDLQADRQAARDAICQAWGVSDQKISRNTKDFNSHIKTPLLTIKHSCQQSKKQVANGDDLYSQPKSTGPSSRATSQTTCSVLLTRPASSLRVTRLASSLRNLPVQQTPSGISRPVTFLPALPQKRAIRAPVATPPSSIADDDNGKDNNPTCSTAFEHRPAPTILFGAMVSDAEDETEDERPLPSRPRGLPIRGPPVAHPSQECLFDFDHVVSEDEEAALDHMLSEDEEAQALEYHKNLEEPKNRQKALENEQRSKDALKLLRTIAHLAAVGSAVVQSTMKAILVHSMTNQNVARYLLENGYAKKRREQVVARKMADNEARKRRAAVRGREPILVPETSLRQYTAPLKNYVAAKRAKKDYSEYLAKGGDIPPVVRPTNVSEAKVDFLMAWLVKNLQFRPGKTRNVRFKKERVTLKHLPVYMRYGSLQSLYESYSDAADDKRVGEKTFRKIVTATSLKGTYNQGLSYFYVDFLDMIKLLLKMLDRLEKIIGDRSIEIRSQDKIKVWLNRARNHTAFASLYLRHGFYGELKKSCPDGFTCAAHALGQKCNHEHTFLPEHKLSFALTNHYLIAHVIELVMAALPDSDFEAFSDEFQSMFDLARLSGLEMFHYIKHLIRGWWQDTSIKELKRMMLEFPWLKGCVLDHKNKLLPRCKDEAMTLFFSKSGISILGAMIFWAGTKEVHGKECKGLFIWFLDMVMANTTAQETRDLLPGLEAIRSELQEDYLVEKAGPTKGLFLLSDNALVAAGLSAYLHALNQKCLDKSLDNETLSTSSRTSLGTSAESEEATSHNQSSMSKASNDFEPNTSEADNGQERVDAFVLRMQSLYRSKVKTWDAHVEPYISQWLTWEAQRCKTELDTHFAYVNKQLARACLEGGIDYLDAEKVFEALAYKGGTRGTTALLLHELPCAQDMFTACDKAIVDRKGINSVHEFSFEPTKVTLSFFSNLDTEKKEMEPNELWPTAEYAVGKVTKRQVHRGEPIFFPFKEMLQDDGSDEPSELDPWLLSTRVYNSLMKHSVDVSFATQDEISVGSPNEKLQQQINEMSETMKEVFEQGDELLSEELGLGLGYPCELRRFWAKKQNRTYLALSDEIMKELARMFKEGQGSKSKAVRYNAERAVMELNAGLLVHLWDQQLICSIAKVKSFFGRKHQAEESENDSNRNMTSEESIASIRERGEQLLAKNRQCEEAILQVTSLELANVSHFHRIAIELLRAFVKSRLLDDAASTIMDRKMPAKGTLRQARDEAICNKTKTCYLSRLAFDLRNEPVKAKVVDPTENEVEQAKNQQIFTVANNAQSEEFEFQDDLANDITLATNNMIEEVDDADPQNANDSDDEDEYGFESDED
jgi:hypothetical protein